MAATRYSFLGYLLICLGLLAGRAAHAQGAAPAWQSLLTSGPASFRTIAVVSSVAGSTGEVYLAGNFTGSVAFGSTTLTSVGGNDLFVARWNGTTNTWGWAVRAGGTADDYMSNIASSGTSLYVTGDSYGPATFGATTLALAGAPNLFVAKLATTPTAAAWGWALGGNSPYDVGTGIATQGSSVYVSGYFDTAITFGTLSLTSDGQTDGFVTKLTDMGTSASYVWAQRLGGTLGDQPTQLAAVGDSLYVAGYSRSTTLTYSGGEPVSTGTGSLFVAKLRDRGTTGTFSWAAQAGGSTFTVPLGLVVSGERVYLSGYFLGTTTQFGSITVAPPGGQSGFLAKLTDAGATAGFTWAQYLGGSGGGNPRGMAVAGQNLYVTGTFGGTIAGSGTTTLASAGYTDIFAARFLDAGSTTSLVWMQQAGGSGHDVPWGMTISSTGTLCVSGQVEAPATFGPLATTGAALSVSAFLATLGPAATLAVAPATTLPSLAVYPNPIAASQPATVQLPAGLGAGPATLTLLDGLGRVVRTRTAVLAAGSPQATLDVAGLAPGVYALRVAVGQRQGTARLVVE